MPAPSAADRLLKGRYTAQANENGTFNLLDLPLVGELKKGERGKLEIDRDWLTRAFKKFRVRESEGYLPPVHVLHHAKDFVAPKAGFLRVSRLGRIKHNGKETDALFGDLTGVSREAFEMIQRGDLPYVSIEFNPEGEPEIASLALLGSQPPQFKFPNLTVREVLPADVAAMPDGVTVLSPQTPAVAFASDNAGHSAVLFSFPTEEKKPKPGEDEDGDGKPDALDADADGDGKPDAEETGEPGALDGEGDGEAAGADALIVEMHAMLKQLHALLAGAPSPGSTAPKPAVNPATMSAATGDAMPANEKMTADPETAGKLAALSSEVETLKADKTARDAEKVREGLVASAVAELADFNITADTRADMATFAALGKDPLDKFVASFKRHARKDPPATLGHLLANATTTEDEAVLAKFSNKGPDTGAKARDLARRFATLRQHSRHIEQMGLERFIENGLQLASIPMGTGGPDDKDEE